jgi:hypothetical protein
MSTNQTIHHISPDVKLDILNNYVEPAYKKDVVDLLHGKRCWKITGQTFETISKVFVAIGSIVSFAAGVYNEPNLSFIAGSISTISLATLQFASFSFRENKKQSQELNTLLNHINLQTIPVIERNTEATFRQSTQTQDNNQHPPIPYDEYMNVMKQVNEEFLARSKDVEELQKKIVELSNKDDKKDEQKEEIKINFHDGV